jgi:hypothetical protein
MRWWGYAARSPRPVGPFELTTQGLEVYVDCGYQRSGKNRAGGAQVMLLDDDRLDLVAVNDIAGADNLAYLLHASGPGFCSA